VEIEGAGYAERDLVLDTRKRGWMSSAGRLGRRHSAEWRNRWVRAAQAEHGEPECEGADEERVRADRERQPPRHDSDREEQQERRESERP
jgi:hypothetical protein